MANKRSAAKKRTTERRFRALQDFEPKAPGTRDPGSPAPGSTACRQGLYGSAYAEGMSYTIRVGETWDLLAWLAPKWEKAGLIEWMDDEDGNQIAALGASASGVGTVN